MKSILVYSILLIIFISCSTLKRERIFIGSYKNRNISVHFKNSKEGKIIVDNNEIVPFIYKIEKVKLAKEKEIQNKRKINYYIYRLTISAEYKLSVPFGFYEIGQKGGDTLKSSEYDLILVK